MSTSSAGGPNFSPNGELAPDSLENRLAASVYLTELGIKGDLESICYQLTVQLAEARKANKDLFDLMSPEVQRYRQRFLRERDLANDVLEELDEMIEQNEMLKAESGFNVDALITAQERLDNALNTIEELSPFIDWNGALNV